MWDGAGTHDLGMLSGATRAEVRAIRATDTLAVGSNSFGQNTVAVFYSQYGVGNLGTLGGPCGSANAISGSLVVGASCPPSGSAVGSCTTSTSGR